MKNISFYIFILSISISISAQKEVYIPKSITSTGMDLNSTSSRWCYARSKQSENIVVFWESGFGSDPSVATGSYRVNITTLLQVAEKSYSMYIDSLGFATKGSSVTDKYKLIIFLLYSTDWTANGSGQDELVGSLQVNPQAANINNVVAHEIGHCFQYITGCDGDGGYRYGFGTNGSGGNGFWEQCANWMAFKVYPEKQFTENDFREYIKGNHLHILHESLRYANYFLPDYWTYKHDITFPGKLWKESRSPEDPVETYKRLNSLSQAQFNDEIYEHATRLTTWDLPNIRSYGSNYIDSRSQVKMKLTSADYWSVDTSACIQNYGYNSIKLNVPLKTTDVTVYFKGNTGSSGYRTINLNKGGWRFGFVTLLKDGTRKYSKMASANVVNSSNPEQSLTFSCSDNCSKLWLVVTGAPQEHWRHPWDDDFTNDEQWPYQVQFKGTNLLGQITPTLTPAFKTTITQINNFNSKGTIFLDHKENWVITNLYGKQILNGSGNKVDISKFANGVYILRYSGRNFKFINELSNKNL